MNHVKELVTMYATAEFAATDATLAGLARARDLDVSVSHADRVFSAPSVPVGQSPLMAALVAFADLGDVSLCTPARRISYAGPTESWS